MDLGAVGDVGVVPRVFHHETGGGTVVELLPPKAEEHPLSPGEDKFHLLHDTLLPEHPGRPLGGGGSASTGGVAVSEFFPVHR